MFGLGKSLRYQQHKDALDETRKLLERVSEADGGLYLRGIPVEFRREFRAPLLRLRDHLETTRIPVDLGDKARLEELVRHLTLAQGMERAIKTAYDLAPVVRDGARVNAHDHIFNELLKAKGRLSGEYFAALERDACGYLLEEAEVAMRWFRDDGCGAARTRDGSPPRRRFSQAAAAQLIAHVKALLAARDAARAAR